MGSEISNFLTQLQAITSFDTLSYKFNVAKVQVFKKFCKDPSNLTLINMLGLDITLTVEIIQNAKVFIQTITYNRKLNENNFSMLALYENFKPESSKPLYQIDIHLLKN